MRRLILTLLAIATLTIATPAHADAPTFGPTVGTTFATITTEDGNAATVATICHASGACYAAIAETLPDGSFITQPGISYQYV